MGKAIIRLIRFIFCRIAMGADAMTISLCMIVKDEEETLGNCLACAAGLADEIIIVDTGSTDRTKAVAGVYTDQIYDFAWTDDFSAARNYSFSKATKEYILWLDADDLIEEDSIQKILELKRETAPLFDAVLMKYVAGVDDSGRMTTAFFRERLLRRSCNFQWTGAVHEYLAISGNILQTDIRILHSKKKSPTDRNLKILEKLVNRGNPSDRTLYYYASELQNNGQAEKASEYFRKFLHSDSPNPDYVSDACMHLSTYYRRAGKPEEALKVLIRSMEYGIMKPEVLCHIGNLCKERGEYEKAIAWDELIFKLLIPKVDLGIHKYELGGFLPCVDLCYCYFQLGNYERAVWYNDLASKYQPDSPIVAYNRKKFREAGIL